MHYYLITSKAGVCLGVYEGDTEQEAFESMREDCGEGFDTDGRSTVGTVSDYIIEMVEA